MVHQNRSNIKMSFNNSFMNSANVRSHVQHKQQLNQRTQKPQQKQLRGQDLAQFNSAVQELCSMYDAVNYFGKAEYAKKNGWRVINKEQLNTATIYAIRYAPVVPKRSARQQQRPQKQQPRQQQPKQQQQQQMKQQPRQQQPRQQAKKQGGRRIGGCQYKPNFPRVYPYNTAPLPSNLYPTVNNYNHLYDAFNYFGNNQVRNIKSWIESSRTHKLSSIASVFAKRNAPYVPVRQNRSNNKRNQQFQKRPQQQQFQRNTPKQQSNKRQRNNNSNNKKRQMINQQPLSNVWEEYYVSPKQRMFK